MPSLHEQGQSLAPGDMVFLYSLDLNPIGHSDIFHFTNGTLNEDGDHVVFGGIDFVPVDLETEGWEYNGKGSFPRPKVRLSNVYDFFSGLLYELDDLVGAKFTRIRTYKNFLDGQANADPEAYYPPDVFQVEQKTHHTQKGIEFVLSAVVDQQGVTLPRRKVFRDTCTHKYRVAKPDGTFSYEKVTCPYAGTNYFDKFGEPTADPTKDQCGFRLSDCKKRFPNQPLPTRAFPGVVRVNLQ